MPSRLKELVKNPKYALIQFSFSCHKRCYGMIAIWKKKKASTIKSWTSNPLCLWLCAGAKRNIVLTGTFPLEGKTHPRPPSRQDDEIIGCRAVSVANKLCLGFCGWQKSIELMGGKGKALSSDSGWVGIVAKPNKHIFQLQPPSHIVRKSVHD